MANPYSLSTDVKNVISSDTYQSYFTNLNDKGASANGSTPAQQTSNIELYQKLAKDNTDALNEVNADQFAGLISTEAANTAKENIQNGTTENGAATAANLPTITEALQANSKKQLKQQAEKRKKALDKVTKIENDLENVNDNEEIDDNQLAFINDYLSVQEPLPWDPVVPDTESGSVTDPEKSIYYYHDAGIFTNQVPADAVLPTNPPEPQAEYNLRQPVETQRFNSWILSWEPTQKVGIVKVPVSKIINALSTNNLTDRANSFEDVNSYTVLDLIDFTRVKGRIYLPLSANKMVVLQDFSINRKNIQQTDTTYGSRYFQVFTESFPEFTMKIVAIKFNDIAKKVKIFFDNVMKRISETSRYSGSLYIHDVIAEDMPSFDVEKLNTLLKTKELTKYRLLPKSIKMDVSAENPHLININIDGIIVEWEKQDESLIPYRPKTQTDSGLERIAAIGPSERYSSSFKANITVPPIKINQGTNVLSSKPVVSKIQNTLYKIDKITLETLGIDRNPYTNSESALKETENFWNLEYLQKQGTGILSDWELNEAGKKDLIESTTSIYQQIATRLSNSYVQGKSDNNTYQNILARAFKDLELPTAQHTNFKAGLKQYLRTVASQAGKASFAKKLLGYKIITQGEYNAFTILGN